MYKDNSKVIMLGEEEGLACEVTVYEKPLKHVSEFECL